MKKIIKRFTAVFTAAAIAFLSASVGAYASSGSYSGDDAASAFEVLSALGITEGEMRDLDDVVTRGEFAAMTSNLMQNDLPVKSYYYTDVLPSSDYAKEIYNLSELGVLNGTGGGTFEPDSPVTASQAAVILVKALNYYDTLKQPPKYPDDYLSRANRLKLFSGVEVGGETELTFGEGYIIMYNALRAPVAIFEDDKLNTDYTVYESFLGLNYDTGVCTATAITTLSGSKTTTLGSKQLEIDGERYTLQNGSTAYYIGQMLEFYYDDDDNIVFARPYENNIITVDYDDVSEFDVNRLEYYENGKKKSASILSGADLIYNGVSYPGYSADDFDFEGGCGTVTLIDNSGDSRYEVIVIEEFVSYVINYADETTETLYYFNHNTSADGESSDLDRSISFDDTDTLEIIRSTDGLSVSFSQLLTNDAASVYMSKDKSYARIMLSPLKVYGQITAIEDDEYTITLQDGSTVEKYKADTNDETVLNTLKLNYSGGFIINHRGRICGTISSYGGEYAYGYLISTNLGENGLDTEMEVKILAADGKIYIYEFNDKSKIDRSRYTSLEKAEKALSLYDEKAEKYYTNQQLIRYSVNAETGVIKDIDTAVLGSEESQDTSLEMMYFSDKEYKYRPSYMYLNRKLAIDINDLVVFFVPRIFDSSINPSEIMNAREDDYFVKYDMKNFVKKESVRMEAAVTDKEGGSTTVVVFLQEYTPSITTGGNPCYENRSSALNAIVDSVGTTVSDDGEDVVLLRVIKNTLVESLVCKYDECALKAVYDEDGNDTGATRQIERGDAIEYYVDENGAAGYVKVIYDVSRTDNGRFNADKENVLKSMSYSSGIIYSKSAKAMKMMRLYDDAPLYDPDNPLATFNENDLVVQTLCANVSMKYFVYDSENDIVRKGTVYDIRDYLNNSSNPSIVIQREAYTVPSVVFIYN